MWCIDFLLNFLWLCIIVPLKRLCREIRRISRLYTIFIVAYGPAVFISSTVLLTQVYNYFFLAIILSTLSITSCIPMLIAAYDEFVKKNRTHAREAQNIHVVYRTDEQDPFAPVLPLPLPLRSVISTPDATSAWRTVEAFQQPIMSHEEIQSSIYRRASPTPRPQKDRKHSSTKSHRRKSKGPETYPPECGSASTSHQRTPAEIEQDLQQHGTIRTVPDVIIHNPDDSIDTPQNLELYSIARQRRFSAHEGLLSPEACYNISAKNDSQKYDSSSIMTRSKTKKKRLEEASTSQQTHNLELLKYEDSSEDDSVVSKLKLNLQEERTYVPIKDNVAIDIDNASDCGTAETSLSDRSESPGSSRLSSPGDGKKRTGDVPKVHVYRKSDKEL